MENFTASDGFHDCVIVATDGELYAHKHILCRHEYFKTALTGPFKEGQSNRLNIDKNKDIVISLLIVIYNEYKNRTTVLDNITFAIEILELCDRYLLDSVKKSIKESLNQCDFTDDLYLIYEKCPGIFDLYKLVENYNCAARNKSQLTCQTRFNFDFVSTFMSNEIQKYEDFELSWTRMLKYVSYDIFIKILDKHNFLYHDFAKNLKYHKIFSEKLFKPERIDEMELKKYATLLSSLFLNLQVGVEVKIYTGTKDYNRNIFKLREN